MNEQSAESSAISEPLVRQHLRFGWWSLVVFIALGLLLETLHGFKIGWYLDVGLETRRLMLTLAHAHGTLLGLVHIAFASTLARLPGKLGRRRTASVCLKASSVLLPGGFLLGGLFIYGGDPGLGIFLVPVGALLLLAAVVLVALDLDAGNFDAGDSEAGDFDAGDSEEATQVEILEHTR